MRKSTTSRATTARIVTAQRVGVATDVRAGAEADESAVTDESKESPGRRLRGLLRLPGTCARHRQARRPRSLVRRSARTMFAKYSPRVGESTARLRHR